MSAPSRSDELSFLRIKELVLAPLPGRFDAAHLRAIHGAIFQDTPEHDPGRYRPETPGGVYVKQRALEAERARYQVPYLTTGMAAAVESALKSFGAVSALRGQPVAEVAGCLARLYGDLDHAHPFREGNSRTLRIFTRQLASATGYVLDWGTQHADAASRDRLYIAHDLAVMERAFPGLNRERAMKTTDRTEYEAWVLFVSRYRDRPQLASLIQAALRLA